MRMLIEIRLLGIRILIDPRTVEALLVFIAPLVGSPGDEKSASSENKTLESSRCGSHLVGGLFAFYRSSSSLPTLTSFALTISQAIKLVHSHKVSEHHLERLETIFVKLRYVPK